MYENKNGVGQERPKRTTSIVRRTNVASSRLETSCVCDLTITEWRTTMSGIRGIAPSFTDRTSIGLKNNEDSDEF